MKVKLVCVVILITIYFNAKAMNNRLKITLGAGCFWCVEAIFSNLKGVESVTSGYSGGHEPNPSYKAVCTGKTGYAEVCQLVYDTHIISTKEILEVFFQVHDPTTLNRQGNDIGTQYRSVIFCHDNHQKKLAHDMIEEFNRQNFFSSKIVTQVQTISNFYPAENYHNDYYENNKNQPYCRLVVTPKVIKFKKKFSNKLK